MIRWRNLATAAAALVLPGTALAQTDDIVRFVTCPIYRDTDAGRKSGCWLADMHETGIRYDVSASPTKPDWNYAVLVEGRVSAGQDGACGGVTLDPVRTSTLEEGCTRHMLPAEGYPGRRYVLEGRFVQPMAVPREVPPPPYEPRSFYLYFEFDRDFLIYQYDDYLIDRAATWLRAAQPRRIVITGYAATDPQTISGRTLAERPQVARERAEMVAEAMRRLLPGTPVGARWESGSTPIDDADADGLPGQSQRRVEIRPEF
ncbi:hypothetical protein [Sphingosinithalassobacter sp. CS137]|uniref:hypothetical protein n=1 Tax=Sphingosinithalassobacter sp. CS137 TaxID=2762748 RepID=UPI0021D2C168|nr:hypothetical protein [Sphingosinithalassobacter sp. CS137]